MLKNISIRGTRVSRASGKKLLRSVIVASSVVFAVSGAQAGTTQIVVQWVDGTNSLSVFRVQGALDDHAQQSGYDSDGNDVGSGTTNFYLYADDKRVDAVVQELISMQKQKLLPDGMRIGVAEYKDAKRKDWSYRPVYPVTLKHFDITYSGKS